MRSLALGSFFALCLALAGCGGSGGRSSGNGDNGGGGSAGSGGGGGPGDSDLGSADGGAGSDAGGSTTGGIFDNCSKTAGCVADCSPPASDPIATGNKDYDLYDGCILAACKAAGLTETWMAQLLKAQAMNESGITPSITTDDTTCGGQNCGPWAISAGASSGDSAPGPCGSSSTDPATGAKDYSHSYGIFQSTPACEGTFLSPALPAGVTCTGTTTVDNIPFAQGTNRFYCESATSIGVTDLEGNQVKGYINAWQDTTSPLYATSIFNPAYQIYLYISYTWKYNFIAANAKATGCTSYQQWYLSLAFWLTGDATTSCTLTGAGLQYVNDALGNYQTLYGSAWPYPGP
ncbi:MAG TPA: hypothetical protein VGL86_30435 [Polyangia bacterium]